MVAVEPGQIWCDEAYYLNPETGEAQRKYVLVLSVEPASADPLIAVLTSKRHGRPVDPRCHLEFPRAGYYVGVLGGPLQTQSWVDFTEVRLLDEWDMARHVESGQKSLLDDDLPKDLLCGVLRCLQGSDDITMRQQRMIGDTIDMLGCPP